MTTEEQKQSESGYHQNEKWYMSDADYYKKYSQVFSKENCIKSSKNRWLKEVDLYEWE